MRPLIIAAMLCTWSACSCGAEPCTPNGGSGFGGAGGGPEAQQIGYAGKPMNVDIDVVENFVGCADPANEQVTGAVVEVLDPSNQKVAATVTPPVQLNGDVNCTVTFTPATPGPYHVVVRLTPNGGTVQRDVIAAVDRRMTAANTFPLGTDRPICDQIDFDGQTLLCRDIAGVLRTMRQSGGQGVTISAMPASAFALSDGRVWVFDPSQGVVVYGLGSDGSLAFRAVAPVGSQGVRTKLLAAGDQALLVDDLGFEQLSVLPDGGISASGQTRVDNTFGAQWLPGVGASVFVSSDAVCNWSLQGGVAPNPDAGSCTSLGSEAVIGYDDDGIWWVDRSMPVLTGQTVFVSGWHNGQTHPTSGSINFFGNTAPDATQAQHPQSSPLLKVTNTNGSTLDLLIPRFDGNFTWYEQWPNLDTTAEVVADPRYVWYDDSGANVLTYYQR